MAHNVRRLEKKRIYNKPHLINLDSFENVTDYLDSRPEGMPDKTELAVLRDIEKEKRKGSLGERSTAVIPVSGVLTYEETWMGAICGMSSYQGIVSQMEQAVDKGYKTVVLDVDSGGGEAYGTFETAKTLRKLAKDNDIKLIAYVDGISASAAYGLSVAADEIILNPYAEVGSIGVVTKLLNDSEKMKKDGVQTTYVYAGDNKIPFDAEGEWREDFIADLQEKVDVLYADFVSHVSEMRSIEKDTVKDTQAKMFSSDNAISLGLADRVMERMEFAEYLADLEEGKDMPLNLFKKDKEEKMSTEDIQAQEEAPAVSLENENHAELIAQLQAQVESLQEEKLSLANEREKEAKAAFVKELSDFSFVSDSEALAEALFGLEDKSKEVVLGVLSAADAALVESATDILSEEVEEEVVDLSEQEKEKATTRSFIKAKYDK